MPLSHIVLHLVLCQSLARLSLRTPVPVHVVLEDRVGKSAIDQVFRVERATASDTTLSFDAPWGVYRLIVVAQGKMPCGDAEYMQILAQHDREVHVTLSERPSVPPPATLITGTTPTSFAYVSPTVVVFDSGTKCNNPVGTPLDAQITTLVLPDAYYTSIYPTHGALPPGSLAAVRLTDSSGGYHFIRMPLQLPTARASWPVVQQFNVSDDVIDYVASKPENTLLCPRILQTITG